MSKFHSLAILQLRSSKPSPICIISVAQIPPGTFPVKFTFNTRRILLALEFKIKSFNRVVGKVYVKVKDLLEAPGDLKIFKFLTCQVMNCFGNPKGTLTNSSKFGDLIKATATGATPAMPMNAGGYISPLLFLRVMVIGRHLK